MKTMLMFCLFCGLLVASLLVIYLNSTDPIVFGVSELGEDDVFSLYGRVRIVSRGLRSREIIWPEVDNDLRAIAQRTLKLQKESVPVTLAFTSSRSGEGKSFVSFEIAGQLRRLGKKVLFIDADVLASKFDFNRRDQLDVLAEDQFSRLFSSDSGVVYADLKIDDFAKIGQYLISTKCQSLFSQFDFILIDLPPVGLVPDVSAVLRTISQCIFVVALGRSKKSSVLHAYSMAIEHSQTKPQLLLNFVRASWSSGRSSDYGYYRRPGATTVSREVMKQSEHIRKPAA